MQAKVGVVESPMLRHGWRSAESGTSPGTVQSSPSGTTTRAPSGRGVGDSLLGLVRPAAHHDGAVVIDAFHEQVEHARGVRRTRVPVAARHGHRRRVRGLQRPLYPGQDRVTGVMPSLMAASVGALTPGPERLDGRHGQVARVGPGRAWSRRSAEHPTTARQRPPTRTAQQLPTSPDAFSAAEPRTGPERQGGGLHGRGE